jgi:ABC-type branched-subunit amino acid transport system ATPase component
MTAEATSAGTASRDGIAGGHALEKPIVLRASSARKAFGGLVAVCDVDLDVHEGEIVGLIGPNGSGKSTFLDLLTGMKKVDSGKIELLGSDVTWKTPAVRAQAGLSRLFQMSRPFVSLTIEENLRVARGANGIATEPAIAAVLDTVGLSSLRGRLTSDLSYGQQRLLDIARCLATGPRIVLLDEPTAGVHQRIIQSMVELIGKFSRERRTSFVIVEHNVSFIAAVVDRLSALVEGSIVAQGTAQEVLANPVVVSAFYGK